MPPTRTVLLTIQFDGRDFHGWQHQPGLRTVQGVLTQALATMVQHEVSATSSSRTDAGVSALAMPVTFDTARDIPLVGFVRGLNTLTPPDLGILDARDVRPGTTARALSVAKTYDYRLQLGSGQRPVTGRFAWLVKRQGLDLDAMREAAQAFIGSHDFSAFRAAGCEARTTERTIHALTITERPDQLVEISVTGNAFLRNMVRIMAGTLTEVGCGKRAAAAIRGALLTGRRTDAGVTAPACGLTLTKVHFDGYPRLHKAAATPRGASNPR